MKPVPTRLQMDWQEQEVGVIIHYDIQVFEQSYRFRKDFSYHPDPKKFAPTALDTDQWIEVAKSAGAKYAILVAKHGSGFALFPSEANDYNVKNAGVTTDIVAAFRASCKKFGLRPGVYYSTVCNAYENVDNPGKVRSGGQEAQDKYNAVLKTQLEELWGNYGPWFEIWFDGGTLPPGEGGLDIAPILKKLQPDAITFQGDRLHPENNTRWVGNENGVAAPDCYSSINGESQADGTVLNAHLNCGDRLGKAWVPAECDLPNRWKQWFYHDHQNFLVLSPRRLLDRYFKSVGRNCNMLIGMVIDKRGLVPEKDAKVFAKFGELVQKTFSTPLATTVCVGTECLLEFGAMKRVKTVVIKEDISRGHTVYGFQLDALSGKGYQTIFEAKVIGHKRIIKLKKVRCEALRLTVTDPEGKVVITEFSAYE